MNDGTSLSKEVTNDSVTEDSIVSCGPSEITTTIIGNRL